MALRGRRSYADGSLGDTQSSGCKQRALVGRRPNHHQRRWVPATMVAGCTRDVGSASPMVSFAHRTTLFQRLPTTIGKERVCASHAAALQPHARASAC
eukprot:3307967-Pyramimonas_sp.AAC.1